MSVLTIVQYPTPVLRQLAEEVDEDVLASNDFAQFANNMMETLESYGPLAVGLSANQVGVLHRIFIINLEVREGEFLKQYFVNPKITSFSKETDLDWEGCLSFNGPEGTPDQWGKVRRATDIVVEAQNLRGDKFKVNAKDFYARLIQHELDHLNGVLFIDKLESELLDTQQLEKMLSEEPEERDPVG